MQISNKRCDKCDLCMESAITDFSYKADNKLKISDITRIVSN